MDDVVKNLYIGFLNVKETAETFVVLLETNKFWRKYTLTGNKEQEMNGIIKAIYVDFLIPDRFEFTRIYYRSVYKTGEQRFFRARALCKKYASTNYTIRSGFDF